MTETTTCKKCPARVRWVQMYKKDGKRGSLGILDAEPSEKGNIRVVVAGNELQGRVLTGEDLRFAKEQTHEPLYTSHFGTCPEAESFRRMGIGKRK